MKWRHYIILKVQLRKKHLTESGGNELVKFISNILYITQINRKRGGKTLQIEVLNG